MKRNEIGSPSEATPRRPLVYIKSIRGRGKQKQNCQLSFRWCEMRVSVCSHFPKRQLAIAAIRHRPTWMTTTTTTDDATHHNQQLEEIETKARIACLYKAKK